MNYTRAFSKHISIYILSFFISSYCLAQEKGNNIIEKFERYTEFPRELAYAHLNKSILAKGEMLGFTVYTFDKFTKSPSTATTNIYCVISDEDDKIIKKKLIQAKDGIANNVFNIDSLFTPGTYKFVAYTNWMLNFNEHNHFSSFINIIESDSVKTATSLNKIDIQLLPEGGHLIKNCQNTIAIIAKDNKGNGIANLKGTIVDSEMSVVSSFQLNSLGIGKTIFNPNGSGNYRIITSHNGENIETKIDKAESIGFNMSAVEVRDKLILNFKTNSSSADILKNKPFTVVIHNGIELNTIGFSFNGELEVTRALDISSLFSGMNIITVFDQNNNPLLERLFFNYADIKKSELDISFISRDTDSIGLKINSKTKVDPSKISALSVSILPKSTESYNFDHNILSTLYLKPYLKGQVERGSYYFENLTPKVKYDLDNLLISQGWSSYDWKDIFNNPPLISNNFEFGISTLVNVNDKNKEGVYVVYPLTNSKTQIFNLDKNDTSFKQRGLFPLENESYSISKTSKNSEGKSNLYVQFFPSSFPDFSIKKDYAFLNQPNIPTEEINRSNLSISWENEAQVLDEVVITTIKKEDRFNKISSKHFGRVDLFDDSKRRSNMTFAMYISNNGYNAFEINGNLNISVRNPTTTNVTPLIYLDDVLLADFTVLYQFRMNIVDYVVIDRMGAQAGIRGAAGVIKIYTDPKYSFSLSDKDVSTKVEFPLVFDAAKKFYVPQYQSYSDEFYRKYGVIDWFPRLEFEDNGGIELKIRDSFQDEIAVFVEGFINSDTFISQHTVLKLR